MQIVIKIEDETYEFIKKFWGAFVGRSNGKKLQYDIVNAIKNGTILPKGHEKLIAEPTEEEIAKTIGGQSDFAECIRDSVKAVFDNAPTIIEGSDSE